MSEDMQGWMSVAYTERIDAIRKVQAAVCTTLYLQRNGQPQRKRGKRVRRERSRLQQTTATYKQGICRWGARHAAISASCWSHHQIPLATTAMMFFGKL